jgi:hypothetical protein
MNDIFHTVNALQPHLAVQYSRDRYAATVDHSNDRRWQHEDGRDNRRQQRVTRRVARHGRGPR